MGPRTSQQRYRSRIMLMTKSSSSLVTLLCLPVLGTYPEWIHITEAKAPGNGWFQLFGRKGSGDTMVLVYAKHPSQRSKNERYLWNVGGLPRWRFSYERHNPARCKTCNGTGREFDGRCSQCSGMEKDVLWDAALVTECKISAVRNESRNIVTYDTIFTGANLRQAMKYQYANGSNCATG